MSQINDADFAPSAPNFKQLVLMNFQGLTNFPYIEDDFDALTNYGLLSKVVEYLNQVISNNNEQNDLMTGLYNAYVELQTYVNTYFDNLDVQEEINNKLDSMAQDGTLTTLIGNYVQPYINAQDQVIENFQNSVNAQIEVIDTKVTNAVSGSPLVASSTSGMSDTTRVYVNTTDGHWYYYNGSVWTDGGVYQSTEISNLSITPYKTKFFDLTNNLLIPELCLLGKTINKSTGEFDSNSNYFVTNAIAIEPNKNYAMFNKAGTYWGNINAIGYYEEDGTFIETVSNVYSSGIKTTNTDAKYMRLQCRVVNVDASYDISQWCVTQIDSPAISGRKWEYYAQLKKELYHQPKNVKTNYIQNLATAGQGGCIMDNLYIDINRSNNTMVTLDLNNLNAYSFYMNDVNDPNPSFNHANDITYNPVTQKIIVADMTTNSLMRFNKDYTFDQTITISASPDVIISGISYDAKNDRYIGYTEADNLIFLDNTFTITSQVPITFVGTKQGMTVYEDKVLISGNDDDGSFIRYYELDGTIIETQRVQSPTANYFEIEGLAIYGNMIIYNGLDSSTNKTYWGIIDNKCVSEFSNFISLLQFIIN